MHGGIISQRAPAYHTKTKLTLRAAAVVWFDVAAVKVGVSRCRDVVRGQLTL